MDRNSSGWELSLLWSFQLGHYYWPFNYCWLSSYLWYLFTLRLSVCFYSYIKRPYLRLASVRQGFPCPCPWPLFLLRSHFIFLAGPWPCVSLVSEAQFIVNFTVNTIVQWHCGNLFVKKLLLSSLFTIITVGIEGVHCSLTSVENVWYWFKKG